MASEREGLTRVKQGQLMLRQFRQAIYNSQPYLISNLHLHHLGRQAFTNPMSILHLELDLSPAPLNQVEEQQVCDVLQFFVTRVRTHIQDLGHWRGSSLVIRPAPFMPNPLFFHNAPKGGVDCFYKEAPLACHIGLHLFTLALQ